MNVIGTGPITRRERLGGLLKFYYREAALHASSFRTGREGSGEALIEISGAIE